MTRLSRVRFLFHCNVVAMKRHVTAQQRSETSKRKHTSVTEEDADDGDDVNGESSRTGGTAVPQNMSLLFLNVLAAKKTRKSLGNPTKVDDEMDEGVQVIDNEPTREEKRCDIAYHFREPVLRLVNGKMKKCCGCKLCPYVFSFSGFLVYEKESFLLGVKNSLLMK